MKKFKIKSYDEFKSAPYLLLEFMDYEELEDNARRKVSFESSAKRYHISPLNIWEEEIKSQINPVFRYKIRKKINFIYEIEITIEKEFNSEKHLSDFKTKHYSNKDRSENVIISNLENKKSIVFHLKIENVEKNIIDDNQYIEYLGLNFYYFLNSYCCL